jgi:hypothetical protein
MMTDQKTLKIVEDLCGALAEEKVRLLPLEKQRGP